MDKKQIYRRWKRHYLRELASVQEAIELCRNGGDADAVHQLRVALRRSRLFALIGRPVMGRKRVSAYREWAQRLADVTSPVRDYDVMIEWAGKVCQDAEFARDLRKDRVKAWWEARKGLAVPMPVNWKKLRRLDANAAERRKVVKRYKRIANTTHEVVEIGAADFERLDFAGRHDFRRAVRRMKYLEEIDKDANRTTSLAKLQLVLGELQNAQTIQGLLAKPRDDVARRRKLLRQAKREESEWYTRCRRSIPRVVSLPLPASQ